MNANANFLKDYTPSGEKLKIFTYPSSVLIRVADPVTEFNDDLKTLCKNMLYTMYRAPGIGLAAPQVGISKRIFVMDIDYARKEVTRADGSSDYELSNFTPQIFINPIFESKTGKVLYEEGCLSVPGIYEKVERADQIKLKFQDIDGKTHLIEAEGLLSICLQHENDHLDGIVFIERLSLLKKNILLKKYKKKKAKASN